MAYCMEELPNCQEVACPLCNQSHGFSVTDDDLKNDALLMKCLQYQQMKVVSKSQTELKEELRRASKSVHNLVIVLTKKLALAYEASKTFHFVANAAIEETQRYIKKLIKELLERQDAILTELGETDDKIGTLFVESAQNNLDQVSRMKKDLERLQDSSNIEPFDVAKFRMQKSRLEQIGQAETEIAPSAHVVFDETQPLSQIDQLGDIIYTNESESMVNLDSKFKGRNRESKKEEFNKVTQENKQLKDELRRQREQIRQMKDDFETQLAQAKMTLTERDSEIEKMQKEING